MTKSYPTDRPSIWPWAVGLNSSRAWGPVKDDCGSRIERLDPDLYDSDHTGRALKEF
jgi:hypothetical protein